MSLIIAESDVGRFGDSGSRSCDRCVGSARIFGFDQRLDVAAVHQRKWKDRSGRILGRHFRLRLPTHHLVHVDEFVQVGRLLRRRLHGMRFEQGGQRLTRCFDLLSA